jgi:hypothetical protein
MEWQVMFFHKKDRERLSLIERIAVRIHRRVDRIELKQLINQKELVQIMSDIQETIQEAAAAQEAETAAVTALKGVVDTVKAEVEAFIAAHPAVDTSGLEAVIAKANATVASIGEVKSEAEAIGAEVSPAPAPAPEPAPAETPAE